jgi:hypothetical protein
MAGTSSSISNAIAISAYPSAPSGRSNAIVPAFRYWMMIGPPFCR